MNGGLKLLGVKVVAAMSYVGECYKFYKLKIF